MGGRASPGLAYRTTSSRATSVPRPSTSSSCSRLALPPLRTRAIALAGELLAQTKRGCERRGAGGLDQVARGLDHRRLRGPDLVVRDEHEVVEVLPEDLLRQLERGARGEAFGERLHPVLDEAAFAPGAVGGRCALRLDADHPHAGTDGRGDDAGAGRAAAAADRDDDRVERRLFLQDLERPGGDARDQQRLVAGVHVAVAVLGREPLAVLARVVEVAAVDDELGAEAAHRGDLDRVRVLGDADRRAHAEQTRGVARSTGRGCRSRP